MARRTPYQVGHYPTRVIGIKCPGPEGGDAGWYPFANHWKCGRCGRILQRRLDKHRPTLDGEFGWIEHYADGSTFTVQPGDTPRSV